MIRPAQSEDLEHLIILCEKHAHFERADYKSKGKSEALAKALFGENPALYCLVAESQESLIGYATYMVQFSTWDAQPYLYLDCLYLEKSARGKGLGKMFMERIKAEAKRLGCRLIQWQTPDFNQNAIAFYQNLGAEAKSKLRFFWSVSEEPVS